MIPAQIEIETKKQRQNKKTEIFLFSVARFFPPHILSGFLSLVFLLPERRKTIFLGIKAPQILRYTSHHLHQHKRKIT